MTLLCLGTQIVLMMRPPPAVWHIMGITGILVTMRMMHKVHISRTVPSVRTVHIAHMKTVLSIRHLMNMTPIVHSVHVIRTMHLLHTLHIVDLQRLVFACLVRSAESAPAERIPIICAHLRVFADGFALSCAGWRRSGRLLGGGCG